ncbi:hypothetical protein GGR56DRAFT_88879 [Xylariaceae sp. FL0804]|nr:hypothetical protein GGR56DRAFT_88879 [Xylariaceae sp. FL0804]
MVSAKSFLLAALPAASAYISSMTAPATAAAGSTFNATLGLSIAQQNQVDFSIVWGLGPRALSGEFDVVYVGTQIQYDNLYPDGEPLPGPKQSFDMEVTVPEGQAAGDWLLVAAITELIGASGLVNVYTYNSNITITAA